MNRDLKEGKEGVTWLSREMHSRQRSQGESRKHTYYARMCTCCMLTFPLIYFITSMPFNFLIETVFACLLDLFPKSSPASAMALEPWSCFIFESLPLLLFQPLRIIVNRPLFSAQFTSVHLPVPQLRGVIHILSCHIQYLTLRLI